MTFARTLGGELVALDPAVIDGFSRRVAARVLVESPPSTSRRGESGTASSTSGLP